MRVLVTAASRYGSTTEIAERISETLHEHGVDATVLSPDDVTSLDPFDAVIVGSGVYIGHWLKPARGFVDRFATELAERPVWLFSSGPVGDPPKPEEDPVDVASIAETTGAMDHAVFGGRIRKKGLRFGDRAVVAALHVPVGDFRDMHAVAGWATAIADELAPKRSSAGRSLPRRSSRRERS